MLALTRAQGKGQQEYGTKRYKLHSERKTKQNELLSTLSSHCGKIVQNLSARYFLKKLYDRVVRYKCKMKNSSDTQNPLIPFTTQILQFVQHIYKQTVLRKLSLHSGNIHILQTITHHKQYI